MNIEGSDLLAPPCLLAHGFLLVISAWSGGFAQGLGYERFLSLYGSSRNRSLLFSTPHWKITEMRHLEEFTFKCLAGLTLDGRLKTKITTGNNAGWGNLETQDAVRVDCLPKPTPRYIMKNAYRVYLLKDLQIVVLQ